MLKSVTLQNFKSFGEAQTVPLSPITVLVGANNSGKSNFLGFARFMRAALDDFTKAVDAEGGSDFVVHRPRVPDARSEFLLKIGWSSTQGRYESTLSLDQAALFQSKEQLGTHAGDAWVTKGYELEFDTNYRVRVDRPFSGLRALLRENSAPRNTQIAGESIRVGELVINARYIRLEILALRRDSEVVPEPAMDLAGAGLASELALWKGSDPQKAAELDGFLRTCLPELASVLVRPAPQKGYQRLWVQQKDGQQFDALHTSDGVLCFIALAMHAISAGEGSLMLVEEPEQCIHPRRLHQYVELLRSAVAKKNCQFLVATHSPVLLNEFRDEPESILLFNRGPRGTKVRRLSDDAALMESLSQNNPGEIDEGKATPGMMLQDGFFNATDA
jgi:predicted ATPase